MNNQESQSSNVDNLNETVEKTLNTEQNDTIQQETVSATPNKKGSLPWIVTTILLAVALIVVVIVLPSNNGKDEVATVNGTKITKDQLYDKMSTYYGESILENMILEEVISQELAAQNITFTDQDLLDEISAVKLSFGGEENFQLALTNYGMSEEDLKDNMRLSALIRKGLESTVTITDEEIQTYFDENVEMIGGAEEIQASHILVATQEEAEKVLAEIKAGGDFATLAQTYSTDGSAAMGGDLGYFGRGQMVPEFEEAAFALNVDEVSDIVKSDFGYHIIKKTAQKDALKLEDVKSAIKIQLVNMAISETSTTWIQELKDKATITNALTDSAADTEEAPAQ